LTELFSQRRGLKPAKCVLQINDIDSDLRSKLWNVLQISLWDSVADDDLYRSANSERFQYLKKLWHLYFKSPLDTLPTSWRKAYATLRTYFFSCEWYAVYDFLEFTAKTFPATYAVERFVSGCNKALEQELSGYRFVADQIAPITDKESIATIEQAQSAGALRGVEAHLQQALRLLSDRQQPDYRNSIKESVCAIEAICRAVSKNSKATLGDALKTVGPKVALHPALSRAFDKLYGYTSDADGIRHALLDTPTLEQEDALFMLVSCSAFINYLTAKCARAGIAL
jgi:AbiJ N-terminal domain 4